MIFRGRRNRSTFTIANHPTRYIKVFETLSLLAATHTHTHRETQTQTRDSREIRAEKFKREKEKMAGFAEEESHLVRS